MTAEDKPTHFVVTDLVNGRLVRKIAYPDTVEWIMKIGIDYAEFRGDRFSLNRLFAKHGNHDGPILEGNQTGLSFHETVGRASKLAYAAGLPVFIGNGKPGGLIVEPN
jgi:hypothetical protein